MKRGLTLSELISEVTRQAGAKQDLVTSTQDNVRMVAAEGFENGVAMVLLKDGSAELDRFAITEHAHRQIAGWLQIPWRYYLRLLNDHKDLVLSQVNALFEREPGRRLIRVLDGRVRAFLSDRYRRLDNHEVLARTLPVIVKGDVETTLLSSHVSENRMDVKVLLTDDRLAQEITARTRTGEARVVRPGFRLSNSETGQGKLRVDGFFFDSYCQNGSVFGKLDAFQFERSHLGGRLIEGIDYEVISDESRRLEDEAIVSHLADVMRSMADPRFAEAMGAELRAAAASSTVANPIAAVELAVEELNLHQEHNAILETFLQDGDYSKWGMAAAVTQAANRDDVTYERANELEDIGSKILSLQLRDWQRFVEAEVDRKAA